MVAALMRFVSVNPYWNVPVDFIASLIAPRVMSGGTSYLVDRRYEVLDSWETTRRLLVQHWSTGLRSRRAGPKLACVNFPVAPTAWGQSSS
jgi:hypothetical protein